jgi:hypothetical protein
MPCFLATNEVAKKLQIFAAPTPRAVSLASPQRLIINISLSVAPDLGKEIANLELTPRTLTESRERKREAADKRVS